MIECIIGPPVTGENLFGREKELDDIWSALEHGSVLLVAPRRIGKTSIVWHMRDSPRGDWNVYYLDIEDLRDPADFVLEIMDSTSHLKSLFDKFKGIFSAFKDVVGEIELVHFKLKLRDELRDEWQSKGNKVFEKIKEENLRIVFAVDELPTMLLNMIDSDNERGAYNARIFLQWLRQVRTNYNIHFIICGSIGVDQILRKSDAVAAMNDLRRIVIPPFTTAIAEDMIRKLLERFGIKYDEQHIKLILAEIGVPIPHFIKIFVQSIANEIRTANSELTTDIIREAYQKRVLGVEGKYYFDYYFTRLKIYYTGKELEAAQRILDHLAIHGESSHMDLLKVFSTVTETNDEQWFNALMEKLGDDFYISYDASKKTYGFYTKVLRDIWVRKLRV